ncbi:hypothetical protein CspeluHIS016_0302180 [Cutaneotrichosporon spelunceum]|uniref:Uncharacterized protein n=1 Tax=Cutaneotrichosporon spelunceum TaxID=1672016 RepID=A0AAD3YBR5_9TREE|nr:hypothetical protein CspeluHIS016_0302180 [Cutaneotrichosporon spelunceum]
MLADFPIPPCPRCNSRDWATKPDGIHCANGHPLRPSLLMSRDAPQPADFTWDGVKGYAHVLHEPSLLTLRHHVNAAMVHISLQHAAHAALADKHAALEGKHAELATRHEGLIALYTDLGGKHAALEAKVGEMEGRVGKMEAVQGALFDVSVSVVPK